MKTQIAKATIETLIHYHLTELAGCAESEVLCESICINYADGSLAINGEHPLSGLFCDYYGEYRDGDPFILPSVEVFADANDLMLEWINPGSVGVYGLEDH